MITKELLDFIKKEKGSGKTEEQIRSELLISGGWNISDLDEGFKEINASNQNNNIAPTVATSHKGRKIVLALALVLVASTVAFGAYHKNDFANIPVLGSFLAKPVASPINQTAQPENPTVAGSVGATTDQQTDCSKVTDPQAKFMCLLPQIQQPTADPKICDQITGTYKDECYYEVGIATKNIAICPVITDQATKDMCYSADATTESTCTIIQTPSSKARCLEKINSKDVTSQLCNSIDKQENGGYEYDTCVNTVAKQTNNISSCKNMATVGDTDSCYFDFATKDLSLKECNLLSANTGSEGRDWCITVIGRLDNNNKSVCNNIADSNERAMCTANIPTN